MDITYRCTKCLQNDSITFNTRNECLSFFNKENRLCDDCKFFPKEDRYTIGFKCEKCQEYVNAEGSITSEEFYKIINDKMLCFKCYYAE